MQPVRMQPKHVNVWFFMHLYKLKKNSLTFFFLNFQWRNKTENGGLKCLAKFQAN